MVSMIGVAGWCCATMRSHVGMVSSGTNALLTKATTIVKKVRLLAASGELTIRPPTADSQQTARISSSTTPAWPASRLVLR